MRKPKFKSAYRLSETYTPMEREVLWGEPTYRIYKPLQNDLENPPAVVHDSVMRLGTSVATYWCDRHGMFACRWEERPERPDWGSLQCPECIDQQIYRCGRPYRNELEPDANIPVTSRIINGR